MSPRFDVVVVGAGIVGAACAYRLSEAGLKVLILERGEAPAGGSTGRSAAGVRVQFSTPVNVLLSAMSIAEYRDFPTLYGADAGYRPEGYLLLVPEANWSSHLEAVAMQRSLGVRVEVLDLEEAANRVPFEAHGLGGATFGPDDGFIDPHAAAMTYLALARERGATLQLESEVVSAEPQAGGWLLRTPHGELRAGRVVNAAGAWAGEVAARAGLRLPVHPARRMIFATAPLPGKPSPMPLTMDLSSGFYMRGEHERLLFGRANPNEPAAFVEGMDWSWLDPTLEVALERFPWLEAASLDRRASWWGYYEITPDHNPILGEDPSAPGWVNACGFSGHGVMHAAATARLIAEEIRDGRATSIDIDPLRIERFRGGALQREHHVV